MIVERAIADDYIYQPVPNNITSQQLHKPIPYGYAAFGLEIVGGPIDGEDSSAGFTLESPDGKYWVAYRTDGDCAGCSIDSAFDWFPWDHSPFSAGEKKAKEKYKMRYQKITEHFTLFSCNHNGREIYSLKNYSNDEFKQLFFSFQNYPTQDTAIIKFNENNLLRIRK